MDQINSFLSSIPKIYTTMIKRLLFVAFLFFPSVLHAFDSTRVFTPLSGVLPSVLKAENSPYVVEADIFVSPGTSVTIESGTILLFNNFTGMHVQGTLYVKGTKELPIVFTSKNDSYYNAYATIAAAPYDWNGIDVYENAIGTFFDNCVVQFTVYGIRSQTENFKIQNSLFLQNGKSNVSIKTETLEVSDIPFSYNMTIAQNELPAKPVLIENPVRKKNTTFKSILRYSGAICAVGGVAGVLWRSQEYSKAKKELEDISKVNDYNKIHYTSEDWQKVRNRHSQELTYMGVYGGVGLLGLLAFGISFTF